MGFWIVLYKVSHIAINLVHIGLKVAGIYKIHVPAIGYIHNSLHVLVVGRTI